MSESTKPELSLEDISKSTGISVGNLERYIRLHEDRIPSQGEGEERRFPQEAVNVFYQLKMEEVRRRKPAEEIEAEEESQEAPPRCEPIPIRLYSGGHIRHAAADGRRIVFSPGNIKADFDLGFLVYGSSRHLLEAGFEFADAAGDVWRAVTRFRSELLIRSMVDISSIDYALQPFHESEEARSTFAQHTLLSDILFFSDDRFIRALPVGNRLLETQFKYTTISMDVAAFYDEPDVEAGSDSLMVRVNESSLYTYDDYEPIESFVFKVPYSVFLLNNTVVRHEDQKWGDGSIPVPLIFDATGEQAEPQPGVSTE